MKIVIALSMLALAAFAADPKTLPNQAGNDDVDLEGTVLIDHKDIQQALGADLEAGFVVVHIKIIPRAGHSILISPDDFTLISRKDGDPEQALALSQIAGSLSVLVVTPWTRGEQAWDKHSHRADYCCVRKLRRGGVCTGSLVARRMRASKPKLPGKTTIR